MSLLQARGIPKSFGSRLILDGLDFDIEPGVRMGVIGPNGGGKSTPLRILAGEAHADAGGVTQGRGPTAGAPGFEGRARAQLVAVGLEAGDQPKPTRVLSGAQRKLVGLAACLLRDPD